MRTFHPFRGGAVRCGQPVEGHGHVFAKRVLQIVGNNYGRGTPTVSAMIYVPHFCYLCRMQKHFVIVFFFKCNSVCSCVKFEIVVNNYPNGSLTWLLGRLTSWRPSQSPPTFTPGYSCDQQLICEPASSPFVIKLKPLIF